MSMKFSSALTVLAVLTAGVLLAAQTSEAPPTTPPRGHSAMGPGNPEAYLQMLSEKLNLTDEQKATLKPMLQDQAQQLKALHEDTSLSPEEKSAKMKSIRESFHKQLSGVLTPEQQAKLKQMRQEAMEKHKEMKEGQTDHQ